jgi:hypothetical protein
VLVIDLPTLQQHRYTAEPGQSAFLSRHTKTLLQQPMRRKQQACVKLMLPAASPNHTAQDGSTSSSDSDDQCVNNTPPHTANCTPPNTRNPSSIHNIHAAPSAAEAAAAVAAGSLQQHMQAIHCVYIGAQPHHTAGHITPPPLIQTKPTTKPAHNRQHPSSAHKLSSSSSSLEHHVHTCIQTGSPADAVCLRLARQGTLLL